jgi:predicted RNase H-like HicB family nuclease
MREVILYRGEENYWIAMCPSLSWCVSQGTTREDAIRNIKEAIEGYILALKDDGLPIPAERFEAMIIAI